MLNISVASTGSAHLADNWTSLFESRTMPVGRLLGSHLGHQ